MCDTSDSSNSRAAEAGSRALDRTASDSRSAAAAPESDDEREKRIVREEFEGLDNDLVDVAKFSDGKEDDEGLGPVDEGEGLPGLREDERTDTADLSVSEYDRSGGRR